jgi:hypothetical protein
MKMNIKNILLGLVAMMLVACGEPDYPTPTPSVTGLTSKLTVVNAAPGSPRVKVKVDNRLMAEKDTIRFEAAPNGKFYSSITLNIPAGPNRLINYADLNDTEGANLVTDRYSATSNTNNTAFLIKTLNTANEEVYSVRRVADDLTLPDVGFAKIRFFHFGFGAGEVKVTTVGGATTVFSARKYNEVSRTTSGVTTDFARFTTVAAGTYSYEIRLTADETILATISNLKLDSKGIYTIYLKGRSPDLSYAVIKH